MVLKLAKRHRLGPKTVILVQPPSTLGRLKDYLLLSILFKGSISKMLVLRLKNLSRLDYSYCFYVPILKEVFTINKTFCTFSGCKNMEADSYLIKPDTYKNQLIFK